MYLQHRNENFHLLRNSFIDKSNVVISFIWQNSNVSMFRNMLMQIKVLLARNKYNILKEYRLRSNYYINLLEILCYVMSKRCERVLCKMTYGVNKMCKKINFNKGNHVYNMILLCV